MRNLGMKKRMAGVLAAVLAFSVSTISASAMELRYKGGHCRGAESTRYVSLDENGMYDTCGLRKMGCYSRADDSFYGNCSHYVDADGNGICDTCGLLRANCHGYVVYGNGTSDNTGDGIEYESPAAGQGYGHGHRSSHGRGCHSHH